VEYEDVKTDVPVYSIDDGVVVVSKYASGYGGVVVIKHQIDGQILYAIYGHLRQSSTLTTGTTVTRGEKIGVLGTGYSGETDGERRHLHFGLAKTNTIAGYVSSISALNATWIDPLTIKGIAE
jgi:murein DD-endopeptidase MepM/ murein hydrolase activator NlpD